MSSIRVVNGETLFLDLDTLDGRFVGVTQYNRNSTTISVNEPTLDELKQLEKAVAILKENAK